MKKLEPRDPANVAAVQTVIDRIRQDWRAEPNVVEISPAIKITNGIPQVDTLAIRFYVRRKVSTEECQGRGWQLIPDEIEDFPTDVTTVTVVPHQVLETRSQRFDTLVGGLTIGNVNLTTVGTLGGFFFHNDDGRTVGLTNEHVLIFNIDGSVGDPVAQPSFGFGAQVAIVEATCCPGGQLSFRNVPNPLADVAGGVFTAAVIAAAASDEIDPHRRGQEATPVPEEERTIRERVQMKIDYSEVPLPGTPYTVGVNWTYERETDRQTHSHRVVETRQNPHLLREQGLLTDRRVYKQGERVHFLATIGIGNPEGSCPPYHVVAHAVSPAGSHARRTVLRPLRDDDLRTLRRPFRQFQPNRARLTRCLHFAAFRAGQNLGRQFSHMMFQFRALGNYSLGVVDMMPRPVSDGVGELQFSDDGMEITLPGDAREIIADVATFTSRVMTLRAYDGDTEVDSDVSGAQQGTIYRLRVVGRRISRLVIEGGGGEGVLLKLCSTRTTGGTLCYYYGSTLLAPIEEVGLWSTYLFVQTLNDVPLGTQPSVAAQTIGGLLASANFASREQLTHIAYGDLCTIDAVPDGDFEVTAH